MYAMGSKKMLNMLILEILQKYSDEGHRLLQKDIVTLLKQEYDMDCDRRTVKSNVFSLIDMGYEINTEDGYYLAERPFEDAELRLLIDSVLFAKTLSNKQAKDLIRKLQGMSSKYFQAKVSHISNLPELQHTNNKQVLYSLDTINDAISEHKQISFIYNSYGTDCKLHPRKAEPYLINPYQMVANNGRYYLIGNYDKYDNISHYRIDKMTDVKCLKSKAKSQKQVKGLENGLNLPKHMAEHIYMFGGESVFIKIELQKYLMNELVDWFGNDFQVLNEKAESIVIRLKCNEHAMRYWALQYGPHLEVLEPESLRDVIRQDVCGMYEKYTQKKGEL